MSPKDQNLRIFSVEPNEILLKVINVDEFINQNSFKIGSYIKIDDDDSVPIIAIVKSFKILDDKENSAYKENEDYPFVIQAQPIGYLDKDKKFKRGGQKIALPPKSAEIVSDEEIKNIYTGIEENVRFIFSTLADNSDIDIAVDGNKFFGKHIALFGSTGSGKSGTVAKILQEAIKPTDDQSSNDKLNNSHIIIFDLHGEYSTAFPDANLLNIENLKLPYWLLNSEELESFFIETGEHSAYNQLVQLQIAITGSKTKHNSLSNLIYDTPVYFDIENVIQYLNNMNRATVHSDDPERLAIQNEINRFTLNDVEKLFESLIFETEKRQTYSKGPFKGEFSKFLMRINNKLNDRRLEFLLKPRKEDGSEYKTDDLPEILQQFTGYLDDLKSNVTIFDLSGVPFEVLAIVVSLLSRIMFILGLSYKKTKDPDKEIPFLLVYEEAHNYVPQSVSAKYSAVKKSIERIAKEGRKYGISLMVVSQRPSEVSETIVSQCNNFVAMRLTNPNDQHYVKRLLPDDLSAVTDNLPILERQEAILLGDSIPIPTHVRIKDLGEHKPSSIDIQVHEEWKKDWCEFDFVKLAKEFQK